MGTQLSQHFRLAEFNCRCCGKAQANPTLVEGLEALRALAYPRGLIIRSGYRCPTRNRAAGGASASQHLHGAAADVDLVADLDDVRDLGVFSGLGYQQMGDRYLVRHVDVRHASGHNTTRSGTAAPALWRY